MTFIPTFKPSDWNDIIQHQNDRSRHASVDAPAKSHFSNESSFDSCMDAALAAPEATFLVKTSSSDKPVIVHGAIECRSSIAGVIDKAHGFHQGVKNPADEA